MLFRSPTFTCRDYTIPCTDTRDANSFRPTIIDNCGTVVNIRYSETILSSDQCNGQYWRVIRRIWTAEDTFGNTGTCTQYIYYTRLSIIGLSWPSHYDGVSVGALPVLECGGSWDSNGNGYPDVSETGTPGGTSCNIQATHRDEVIKVCGDDAGDRKSVV